MSNYIRVKTSTIESHVDNRLSYDPEIVEIYLTPKDLEEENHLIDTIHRIKEAGARVYLHHPDRYTGVHLDILSEDPLMRAYYERSSKKLATICKKEGIKCVIHAHYAGTESSKQVSLEKTKRMRDQIKAIEKFAEGCFLWEDTIEGIFSYKNPYLIDEIIIPLRLSLNVDISHTFISFQGNSEKLEETLIRTKPFTKYYHVVDSKGLEHDSLPLGEGSIDWRKIKSYLMDCDFIFEIGLQDLSRCDEMIQGSNYFKQI